MQSQAILAQQPTTVLQPPTPSALESWGIQGAIAFLVIKEAWTLLGKRQENQGKVFLQKEEAESALITSLVDGLKRNQEQLLSQLLAQQNQFHQDMGALRDAIAQLTVSISQTNRAHEDLQARISRLEHKE